MIDTLILSGGGPSGISYIGIFRALLEQNKIIKTDLNEIITTSVGMVFSILYLLDFTVDQMEQIILEVDLQNMLNSSDIEIDLLLLSYGLFSNKLIGESVFSFCKHKVGQELITLKELYDLIPIKLTVKVYNVDKGRIEYMSYENEPNIPLSQLAMMTTAIPFLFTPITYNECLYTDGGLKGHFPIEECHSENYLGILIEGGTCGHESFPIIKTIPILGYIMNLMNDKDNNITNYDKNKIIILNINIGLNFSLDKDKKNEVIKQGYDTCMEFLNDELNDELKNS